MSGRPGRRAFASIAFTAALLLCGCATRFERFAFTLTDGTKIDLRESPGMGKEDEGLLKPAASGGATPLYTLSRPAEPAPGAEALELLYTSTLDDCLLTVYAGEKETLAEVSIPETGQYAYRILIPLAPGGRIWGFKLSTHGSGGSLKLMAAGTARRRFGFVIDDGQILLDGSVQIRSMDTESLRARISDAARSAMTDAPWTLGIVLGPSASGQELSASFTADVPGARPRKFTLRPDAGLSRFVFPAGGIPFVPKEIVIETPYAGTAAGKNGNAAAGSAPPGAAAAPLVQSVIIGSIPDGDPIPADPGIVLGFERARWRNVNYEVFSWTRFPGVLIFDTADYGVQDGFFKRLAFFVEKPGYAGTIPDPSELEGKHGWNAHDYKAEDLARFFNTARAEGVALTGGETGLLGLLLSRGIITDGDSGYRGGQGAVLSISRQSGEALRRLLILHECFHGVFFSLPGFREACAKTWSALSGVEREVWLLFLQSNSYDTSNQSLVVNEFQSYLFQQAREEVPGYQALITGRLRAKYPGKAALLERFQDEYSDSFLRSFDLLERALLAAGGPPGGLAISAE